MHVEHHHWTNPKGVCQHWSGLIIVESNLSLLNNPVSTYNVAIKRPLRSTSSLKAEADIEGKAFMERKRMSLVGVLSFGAELTIRGQASADNYSSTEIRLEQCLLLTSIHTDTQTRQMRLTLVQPTGLYSRTCFTKDYLPPLPKLPPPAFFSSSAPRDTRRQPRQSREIGDMSCQAPAHGSSGSTAPIRSLANTQIDRRLSASATPDSHEPTLALDGHAVQIGTFADTGNPSLPKTSPSQDVYSSPTSSAPPSTTNSAKTLHFVGFPHQVPVITTMTHEPVYFCGRNFDPKTETWSTYHPLPGDGRFDINDQHLRAIVADGDSAKIEAAGNTLLGFLTIC